MNKWLTHWRECRSRTAAAASGMAIFVVLSDPAVARTPTRQPEPGAFATSYIPNTFAAATRAADVAAKPAGAWFNTAAGKVTTLAAFIDPSGVSPSGVSRTGKNGLTVNGSNQVALFDTAGAFDATLGPEPIGTAFKAGFASTSGAQRAGLTAGIAQTASATSPTADMSSLGPGQDGTARQPSRYLRRLRHWPGALTAAQLMLLTK